MTKVLALYHSMYGHIERLAELAVARFRGEHVARLAKKPARAGSHPRAKGVTRWAS